MDTYGFAILGLGFVIGLIAHFTKHDGWVKFAFFLMGGGIGVIIASIACYNICLDVARNALFN